MRTESGFVKFTVRGLKQFHIYIMMFDVIITCVRALDEQYLSANKNYARSHFVRRRHTFSNTFKLTGIRFT